MIFILYFYRLDMKKKHRIKNMDEQENKNNTADSLAHRHGFRIPLVLFGIVTGAAAGGFTCLYRFLIDKASLLLADINNFISGNPFLIALWFGVLAFLAWLVSLIIQYEPLIKGSGIPQTEGVLLRQVDMKWWKVLAAKFTGGLICMFAGLSLGREGPSIQLGGAVGQGVRKIFKRHESEEKYLITGGASAGLAAAFNAPLAGVVFALEEVHRHFSPTVLLTAMSSAITADLVSKLIFGGSPVLSFQAIPVLPLELNAWLLPLGLLVGLGGVLFNTTIAKTQDAFDLLPAKYRPFIPFLLAGVIGLLLPAALGGGHSLIISSAAGDFGLKMLLILLGVRFVFTMASFGSGAPGGIFLPLLTLGALIGGAFGSAVSSLSGMDQSYVLTFIALAMAGYFSAVVRAPVTGIILITEMTGTFSHLLSLSIIVIVAYLTAELMRSKPVYESLLERLLRGNVKRTSTEHGKVILEAVVFVDSPLDGAQIKTVPWPEKCLIVGIKRGSSEILPNGDTTILSGDLLIVLVDSANSARTKKQIMQMASDA
jgi:H+/Cl- antiporter ClcA